MTQISQMKNCLFICVICGICGSNLFSVFF